MSNYSKLYWLTRLDNIQILLTFLIIFGVFYLLVLGVYRFITYVEDDDIVKRPWHWVIGFFFLTIGVLGKTFTPTRNEAIFIVAGGKITDFVENDTSINKIPSQTTAILSTWLDKEIKKLKGNVDSTNNK